MSAPARLFLFLGGLNAALAVVLGAFGAHALKAQLAGDMLAVYQTANQYHWYHALGLVGIGLAALWLPASRYLKWAGWVMMAGIVLFCASLYVLSVSGLRGLGMVTPFGGVAFIAAWVLFCVAVFKAATPEKQRP